MHNGLNQFGQVLVDYLRCTAGVPHSRHPKKAAAMPTQAELDQRLTDTPQALKAEESAAHTLVKFSHWLDQNINFTWAGAALVASVPGNIALRCTNIELNDCDDDDDDNAESDAPSADTDKQKHYCHLRTVREKYGQCRVAELLRQEPALLQKALANAATVSSSGSGSSSSSSSNKRKRDGTSDSSSAAALPVRNLAADMSAETSSNNSKTSSNSNSNSSNSCNNSSNNSNTAVSASAANASDSASSDMHGNSSGSSSKLIAQCSSLSCAKAFTADWMQQFYRNCMPNSTSSSAVSFNEHLQIVWPTVRSVRESLGGFVGGVAVKWRPHKTDSKVRVVYAELFALFSMLRTRCMLLGYAVRQQYKSLLLHNIIHLAATAL
jgi:Tyrosyl-DNA phosphodiesterase